MIRLSPSTLNLFRECQRCFWLHVKENIHRPQGPFPSLPSGMDLVIKEYFDSFRDGKSVPPELNGKVDGVLFADKALLAQWRNWRTGLSYEDKKRAGILSGALDDCLFDGKFYIPLDYKTRGFAPKEDGHEFYQGQLDVYTLLLSENKYPTRNVAYLVYYYPRNVEEGGRVFFEVEVKEVKTDAERARKEFEDALSLLAAPIPKAHSSCTFCSWGELHSNGLV